MGRKELFTRIGNTGEGRRAGLVLDMLSSGSWVWRCLFGITSVCIIVEAINTKLSMKVVHLKGEEKKNSKRNGNINICKCPEGDLHKSKKGRF